MNVERAVAVAILMVGASMSPAGVRAQRSFDTTLLAPFTYRNIGPFRMQARIADIAVPASPEKAHRYTMYVAPWIGGVFKTANSGTTWTKVLYIDDNIGVIDLVMNPRNPEVLYAIVENENLRPGAKVPTGPGAGGPGHRFPVVGGATWTKMNPDSVNVSPKGPYYFNQIRVDPNNDQVLFLTGYPGGLSHDGGRSFDGHVFPSFFGDFRTFWFDPENSDRMIIGSDGGIAVSYDGGTTSDAYSNLPLGSVYTVSADMQDPYNVYAGLQDHENWTGPSNSASGHITEQGWFAVGDGDGIVTLPDPTNGRWLYTTREYGAPERVDQKLGYRTNITPQRDSTKTPYRYLWEIPLTISPHDSHVITEDYGATWTSIAGDLPKKPINVVFEDRTNPNPLFVGNDAGVYVSIDGGTHWVNMNNNMPRVPVHDLLRPTEHPDAERAERDGDPVLPAASGTRQWNDRHHQRQGTRRRPARGANRGGNELRGLEYAHRGTREARPARPRGLVHLWSAGLRHRRSCRSPR